MAEYDVVLRGGRVIDPESGLDAVCDVAIGGDRVAAVGTSLPPGRQEADVTGQVVTAGFIDLHSHAHDLGSARLQVTDGVTTALELEAGATLSSSPRTGLSTAPRRSSAPRARPVPACTTATSTAPRSGTPTGCSGWSSGRSGRAR